MSGKTQELLSVVEVPPPDRILVVEADAKALATTCDMVKAIGYECHAAHTAAEATLALNRERTPIVLLDHALPEGGGLKLIRDLRSQHSDTYILVLADRGHEEAAAEGMRAGAVDFLLKPIPSAEVLREVLDKVIRLREAELRNRLLVKRLAEANRNLEHKIEERTNELSEKNRILEEMSRRDQLTGLFNQRYLLERLQYEIFRIERYTRPLSFAMIDLDNLKEINDTLFDHQAGSRSLKIFSDLLRSSVRRTDMAARYGGDEFALIAVETGPDDTKALVDRVRTALESTEIVYNQNSFHITASGGVATYESGLTVADLIRRADRALYRAKHNGRNQICTFDPSIDDVR